MLCLLGLLIQIIKFKTSRAITKFLANERKHKILPIIYVRNKTKTEKGLFLS